ncbi:MAG: hypothetical protein SFY66_19175 [Oculatellaceae cyanobacterium bins.114]|nr:hypothetical protein [Oculatellaceae cyanobacterium bins.114]
MLKKRLWLDIKPLLVLFPLVLAPLLLTGCKASPTEPEMTIQLEQQWVLQPGDQVAGRRIQGGLGDISVELAGQPVYAPYDGRVRPVSGNADCVFYSSPELPAYLFRWCGVTQPKLGSVQQGDSVAIANTLEFATLRKQPSGRWAMVEPSIQILERTLTGELQ